MNMQNTYQRFWRVTSKVRDKIKVGYVPYSKDLSHPGDRRRILTWAKSTSNTLLIDSPFESDLLVLSGGVNFNYWIKNAKQPVVLDLVDGYLGENPNLFLDFGRNLIRSLNGKSNYSAGTFTRSLKKACLSVDAVVVASPEQAKDVSPFNSNVHIILDDHSELDSARRLRSLIALEPKSERYILWEGFGFTLKHFKFISKQLDNFLFLHNFNLILLTNPIFARWGGYLGRIDSNKLIRKWFPLSKDQIEIIPWSVENLIRNAAKSEFAIIPIDTADRFANLKPENKLLSMWHLGLPTLFSNTQAYRRVANLVEIPEHCLDQKDWSNAFENFEVLDLNQSAHRTEKYIAETHTREILIKKWQLLFDSVLRPDGKI